jgi:hypothetical protein
MKPTNKFTCAALKAMLAHEGEREVSGIGTEHDSDALEAAKRLAYAAIASAEEGPMSLHLTAAFDKDGVNLAMTLHHPKDRAKARQHLRRFARGCFGIGARDVTFETVDAATWLEPGAIMRLEALR